MQRFLAIFDRLRPYTSYLAVPAVAVILGLGIGLHTLFSPAPAIDTTDRWPLPKWTPYRAAGKREVVKTVAWVDDPSKQKKLEATPKPESPPWRFVGTMQDGKQRVAIIEVDRGTRVQRIAEGQDLPNGAQVSKISAGELTYREDGSEKTLTLFAAEKPIGVPQETRKR